MAGWNDRSRGSAPQPPSRAAYSREWRSGSATRRRPTPKRVLIAGFGLLLAALVGVLAYFIILPTAGNVPKARLVLVGISSYQERAIPPNAFARDDVAALHALQQFNPRQFPEEKPWDDMLTGRTLLDQMGHKLQQMQGENLIVFCSLHAIVRPGEPSGVELYAIHADPDSPHSGGSDQMIPLRDLLGALGKTSAERIVLLLDAGRLLPNWRLGVLAADVAAQLEQDVAQTSVPRLTILCSAGSHERSWAAPEWKQSVFGHFLVEGMKGAADGWSERGAARRSPDRRVSMDELYGYVRDSVGAWAREHRGVAQSVIRFGSDEDFPLIALRDPEPKPEKKAPAAEGEPEKAKSAKSETASTSESRKGKTRKSGGEPKAAAAEKKVDRWEKLNGPWSERDRLNRDGRVAGISPHRWRRLQAFLLSAEQQLRAGLTQEAEATLAHAAGLLTELQRAGLPAELKSEAPRVALSLGSLLGADRIDAATEQRIVQHVQPIIAAAKAPPKPPAEGAAAAPPAGSAQPPAAEPPAPELLAQWLVREAAKNPSRERLVELGAVLQSIDPAQWPGDLISLGRLIERAQPSDSSWLSSLAARLLTLRNRAPSEAILNPVVLPLVRDHLREALRALDAAERWMVADGGANGQADEWLRRAEQSFALAERTGEQVAQDVQLRDELLVMLPDFARWIAFRADEARDRSVDWDAIREAVERMRRRAELDQPLDTAFADELLRSWPDSPGEQDQRERLLLRLMLKAQLLQSALTDAASSASPGDTLTRLSVAAADLRSDWLQFERVFNVDLNVVTRRGQITAEDWRTAERLLLNPWIEAEQRRQLLEILSIEPRGGFYKPVENQQDDRGVWQGFWAIQTLALAGSEDDHLARLWKEWDELLESVTSSAKERDAVGIRQRRSQLGRLINREWSGLAQRAGRPPEGDPKWELVVRGLDPFDEPSSNPDRWFVDARRGRVGEYLSLHLEDWQRRSEQHPAYALAIGRGRNLLDQLNPGTLPTASAIAPRLASVEAPLFDADRTAELKIATSASNGVPGLKLLLQTERMQIRRDGALIDTAKPVEVRGVENAFDLKLDASVVAPQPILIALVGPDGFPWDIRPDLLAAPPFDPSSWRIEFQTVKEGRRVHQEPMIGGSKVFLPPSDTVGLRAVLLRPSSDLAASADVTVYRQLANGARAELIPKTTVQLAPGGAPTPLSLNVGGSSPATPPPGAAPPPAAAEPPADPIEIAGGLVFELTPQGRDTFTYVVQPVFWSAEKLVELPQPVFQGETLSVSVVRRTPQPVENEDLLLPAKIAVSLEIPEELLRVAQSRVLGSAEPSLGFGERRELSAGFDRARLEDRYHEIKLNVGGLPHAYRWRVRADERPVLLPGKPPLVRIASPAEGAVLKQEKDQLTIRLEVDASELDLTGGGHEAWRLGYDIVRIEDGRRANVGRADSWPLQSSREQHAGLVSLKEGVWEIATSTRDHQRELGTAGLAGRFLLLARLEQSGRIVAEDQIEFAIDDETSPKVSLALGARTHRRDQPLTMRVQAEDRQSGITSLAVGLDANGSGQLEDEERAFEKSLPPIKSPLVEESLSILPQFFPPTAGTYDVLAVASSGVGASFTQKQRINLQDPPKPPPKPQPTTGTLVVKLSSARGKKTVTVSGPTRRTLTAESGESSVRFTELQPGAYTVDVAAYLKRGSAKDVQVTAGQTAEVEVTVQ